MREVHRHPDLFRFAVIGLDAFTAAILGGSAWHRSLGLLLSMAETTFLEVVEPEHLREALQIAMARAPRDASTAMMPAGLVRHALAVAGVDGADIRLLSDDEAVASGRMMIRVDLQRLARTVLSDCTGSQMLLRLRSRGRGLRPRVVLTLNDDDGVERALPRAGRAVTLSLVLALHPSAPDRQALFRSYLHVPLHSDMCPLSLVVQRRALMYDDFAVPAWTASQAALATEADAVMEDPWQHHLSHYGEETRQLMQLLLPQLQARPFSFLEYGSGAGELSMAIASAFPRSTVVSLEGSRALAQRHAEQIDALGLKNNVVCVQPVDASFVHKLFESPEFLRYQMLREAPLLHALAQLPVAEFGLLLGEALSTSLSTFIQVPARARRAAVAIGRPILTATRPTLRCRRRACCRSR